MNSLEKQILRQKRIWRIRKKVRGTAERPRLCVHLSNKHVYAQLIDDEKGDTLLSLSSVGKGMRQDGLKANVESAGQLGKAFGEKAGAKGVSAVVFDRNGRNYHGAVKAFADAVRETGLVV